MLRIFLTTVSAVFLLVCVTTAAEAEPKNIELAVNVSSFGYQPKKGVDWLIDQPSPSKDFTMTLDRDDRRMAFGEAIPGWSGTKEVVLRGEYRIRVKARYLQGEPRGDFKGDKPGLSLDVSFLYDKQLIGFQTVTEWKGPQTKVTADLKDIAYFNLLQQNEFELTPVTDGYGDGFRAWAAVRDGIKKRDNKEASYESLTEFLKPLARKDNLMIPTVTVTAKVKQPE